MFLGLRTVIYMVDDLQQAKAWYTALLGQQPYFDEVFYVGYNVGGFELGLHPREAKEHSGHSPVSYWGVANIEVAFEKLLELGATVHQFVQDVGGGIKVASLYDPFGNLVGIIENSHFDKDSVA